MLDLPSWLQKRMNCDWSDLEARKAYFHPRKLHLSLHNNIRHCHSLSWSNLEVISKIQKCRLVDSLLLMRIQLELVHRLTELHFRFGNKLISRKLRQKLTPAISEAISSPFSNFCSSWIILVKPSMKILTKSISDLPSLS